MRFDQIWFRYARRAPWALEAVDAAVHPGETIVVLGRNGAGKSTLLQLAAGVLQPTRGAVRDRPQVIGWVPERFPADQPFTAGQYLTRMAAVRGLRGIAEVDHWVERLMLTEHVHTRLAELSKGTAQKVGLAQALLAKPGLLVLDEPWEGLDAVARTLIPEIVAEVTAAGGAVLVSDHRGEIAGLADATRWTVADTTVRPETASPVSLGSAGPIRLGPAGAARPETAGAAGPETADPAPDEVVVEIAVRRLEAEAAVSKLRADGHRVLRVRESAGIAGLGKAGDAALGEAAGVRESGGGGWPR